MLRRQPAVGLALLLAIALPVCALAAAAAPPRPTADQTAPTKPGAVRELATRNDLKPFFNDGQGKVRIVAFLSPTCSHCIANCQQLQKLVFEQVDAPNLEMHAVWLKMLDTDSKERIAAARQVLSDPRVQHYWDPEHRMNPQLLDVIGFDIMMRLYDIFLLYDGKSTWDKRLPVPGFWMHMTRGAPGPTFNGQGFAVQVGKALAGEPLDTPR